MNNILNILLLFYSLSFGLKIDFFKEDITFRLDSDFFNIEGYYWFTNQSDNTLNKKIYYPFPYYAGSQIDSIQVYDISVGHEIIFWKEGNYGISFPLSIAFNDTALLQIKYRQKINSDSAVYILKTTQSWGKPLKNAEFKLITHESFLIKKFSYQPDRTFIMDNYKIYYWKRENFIPRLNMVFYF